MTKRGLLALIALLLFGILLALMVDTERKPATPLQKVGNDIGEAVEDLGDEIQDQANGSNK